MSRLIFLRAPSIRENEKRGVLSLFGDDGYPYGLPLSRVQCLELEIEHMTGKLVNE